LGGRLATTEILLYGQQRHEELFTMKVMKAMKNRLLRRTVMAGRPGFAEPCV